jgi:hypothetical protein
LNYYQFSKNKYLNANKDKSHEKIIVCLSGHHHQDYLKEINGIYFAFSKDAGIDSDGKMH